MKSTSPLRILTPTWAFLLCLLMTCGATLSTVYTSRVENQGRFDRTVGTFMNTLRTRMTAYSNAILSTRSLFQVKPDLTEEEFQHFVGALEIRENFPGIQNLGYVERVSLPQAKRWLQQKNIPLEKAQIPAGATAVSLVKFVQLLGDSKNSVLGLDLGATEIRRVAMDQARDNGEMVASAAVVPLTNVTDTRPSSFLVFSPIYHDRKVPETLEARRHQLKGFVYAGFRSENLFGRISRDLRLRDADFFVEVFDGSVASADKLIFSEGDLNNASGFETTRVFTFAEHSWTIRVVAPKAFLVVYLRWAPYVVFAFGLLISLVVAFVLNTSQAARLEADNANRAKSLFLANVSHEIRTPLGVMIGFAEMTLNQNSAQERESNLKTIIRNGRELTRIIGDVLDVSKIEANMLKIQTAPFTVEKLTADLIEVWKPQVEAKGVQFSLTVDSKIPTHVIADQTRIKQIVINLISNAIKFTAHGFVRLNISLDPDNSQNLQFSVKDSGIGISAANQKKLFQPFSQGDSSITRKFGGNGLGLALSKEIAAVMGGSLKLGYSTEGHGSEFVLTVPFLAVDTPPKSVATAAKTVLPSLKGKRILLVEDSSDNRALVSLMLNRVEALVDTAKDGEEGVKKALAGNYDLILMDIQMPVKDGYTAFLELKAQNCQIPIVALTAHALTEERDKAISMGFTDFLTKPVDFHALVSIAVSVTGKRSAAELSDFS